MVKTVKEFLKNPKSVKDLAEEIKALTDAYWGKEILEQKAKELVIYWTIHEKEKLFKDDKLSSTITKIIGKKRTDLINKWIDDAEIGITD